MDLTVSDASGKDIPQDTVCKVNGGGAIGASSVILAYVGLAANPCTEGAIVSLLSWRMS